ADVAWPQARPRRRSSLRSCQDASAAGPAFLQNRLQPGDVSGEQNRLQPVDVSGECHLLSDTVRAAAKGRESIAIAEERCQRVAERPPGRRLTNGDAIDALSQPL